jgi:hypothetical protein
MKLQALLPMIALLGLLGGCSQSGQSGTDNAKKYTNPDENKKGGSGQGQQGQASGQGDTVTGGKADNNSGGPAANMANSSNSYDAQTTKHQPGMSANDDKAQNQKSGSSTPPPK